MSERYLHDRKGVIVGDIVRQDDTWTHIRLAGDQRLRYMSEANRGRIDCDGDILTVRTTSIRRLGDAS